MVRTVTPRNFAACLVVSRSCVLSAGLLSLFIEDSPFWGFMVIAPFCLSMLVKFYRQNNFNTDELIRQGDEEPPVRLGGFSFYILLRLLLEEGEELLEDSLSSLSLLSSLNFSQGTKQS